LQIQNEIHFGAVLLICREHRLEPLYSFERLLNLGKNQGGTAEVRFRPFLGI